MYVGSFHTTTRAHENTKELQKARVVQPLVASGTPHLARSQLFVVGIKDKSVYQRELL
jgi:hypothetical protein